VWRRPDPPRRFERHGGPPDLQAAFEHLVRDCLKGRVLDDQKDKEAAAGRFPDFACFRDLVLIEMKHLESDQSARINAVLDEKTDPDEKPLFFGSRDGKVVLDKLSNGVEIQRELGNKLSRTIENILSSANKQFASYRARHPRKNSVSLCVILNSSLQEFTPQVVAHAIRRKERKSGSDEPRFSDIDAIVYLTEKHFIKLPDGRVAFGITSYGGAGMLHAPWKRAVLDRIVDEWSQMRTGGESVSGLSPLNFEAIEDIPDEVTRSQYWILEYRRSPYLQNWPTDRLKILFNRCLALSAVAFVRGDWPKPSMDDIQHQNRIFSHVNEEANRRGIDLREFGRDRLSPEEQAEIYEGLPVELVKMLTAKSTKDPR
jgi:hypothetical protein